jgi:ABC-type sugar transport system permease subunit
MTIASPDVSGAGFGNYALVLRDGKFWLALRNTFLVSGADIFAGMTAGFLLSIFLSFKFRGRKLFHTLFFIPAMLPIAFIAAVFSSMLEYREGTLNALLRLLRLDFAALRWLAQPQLAVMSVMSVSIYLIGVPIMYYTADLTTINKSVLEAAIIDGARFRDMLLSILFPLLRNSHKTIALSMLLGGFRQMERVYLMTDGGPGGATEIVGTYIYRMIRSPGADYGIVSAAASLVLLVAFAIAFAQLKLFSGKGG